MTPLPKHLRPRYRYLGVTLETWPDVTFDRGRFQDSLSGAVRALFGDSGVAATDPRVVRFALADGSGRAVIRTRRDAVGTTRAALAAMPEVDGAKLAACVRGISGTVRACEEKYLQGRQLPIAESTVAFEGADRRATVRGSRVDVRIEDAFVGATDLDLT